jgi:nucleotide-binding universal stress UspA family protein
MAIELDTLLAQARDSPTVKRVFGEPEPQPRHAHVARSAPHARRATPAIAGQPGRPSTVSRPDKPALAAAWPGSTYALPAPRQTGRPRTTSGSGVVLVALDGSPAAARALPLARAVALQLGARLEGLHVVEAEAADADPATDVRRQLDDCEAVRIPGAATDSACAILDAAREPWVELVMLTIQGRTSASGQSLGHVARSVLAHTRRPLLLVPPDQAPAGPGCVAPLRRLLLPLDGSPTTTAALRPALDLAARLDAAVDILLVAADCEPTRPEPGSVAAPRYVDQPQHEWADWRARVLGHLAAHAGAPPPNVTLRVFLAAGDIAHQISSFAAEHHADAVILVRRSHLEVGRARVLRAVLDHTACPVVLLAAESGATARPGRRPRTRPCRRGRAPHPRDVADGIEDRVRAAPTCPDRQPARPSDQRPWGAGRRRSPVATGARRS